MCPMCSVPMIKWAEITKKFLRLITFADVGLRKSSEAGWRNVWKLISIFILFICLFVLKNLYSTILLLERKQESSKHICKKATSSAFVHAVSGLESSKP